MTDKRKRDRSHTIASRDTMKLQLASDVDREIYGRQLDVNTSDFDLGHRVAEPLPIHDILPDPIQPRRAIPLKIRETWDSDPSSLPELFEFWMGEAAHERKEEFFSIEALLKAEPAGGETDEPQFVITPERPLEAALLQIAEIAASIRQHGLINPITVVSYGNVYRLETGERRWLAYHLLHLHFPNEKWSTIPAQLVDKIDRFRQASENMQRNDLNMVARARQYALLLMELLPDVRFTPHDQAESDRAFYAQVLDHRVPHGKNESILQAFGVTSRGALDNYKKALELSDDDWNSADDNNWSKEKILEIVHLVNNLPTISAKSAENSLSDTHFTRVQQFHKSLRKMRKDLDKTGRTQVAQMLRDMADEIEKD